MRYANLLTSGELNAYLADIQQIMFKGSDRRLAEFPLPKRSVPAPIPYA